MAFAKGHNIDISQACKLGNGPTIQAGMYNVKVINTQSKPEAVFYKSGKEVAQVPVKLVNAPKKFDQTEILSQAVGKQNILTELRFRGWTEKVLLKGAPMTEKSNP